MAARMPATLWAGRLSIDARGIDPVARGDARQGARGITMSPGCSAGASIGSIQARKMLPFMAPSVT